MASGRATVATFWYDAGAAKFYARCNVILDTAIDGSYNRGVIIESPAMYDTFALRGQIATALGTAYGDVISAGQLVMDESGQNPTPSALSTAAATITWDFTTANVHAGFTLSATGKTLSADFTDCPNGTMVTLQVTQNGTGGYDLIFDSAKFGGLIRGPFLAANAISEYRFMYNSTAGKLYPVGGFAWRTKILAEGTLPYTVLAADYCTQLVYTGTSSGAVNLPAMTRDFEVALAQKSSGIPTLTPNGAEKLLIDPAVSGGSASYAFPSLFTNIWAVTDGTNGWYFR